MVYQGRKTKRVGSGGFRAWKGLPRIKLQQTPTQSFFWLVTQSSHLRPSVFPFSLFSFAVPFSKGKTLRTRLHWTWQSSWTLFQGCFGDENSRLPWSPLFSFGDESIVFTMGIGCLKKSVCSRRYFGLVSYGSNWNVLSGTQREIL